MKPFTGDASEREPATKYSDSAFNWLLLVAIVAFVVIGYIVLKFVL